MPSGYFLEVGQDVVELPQHEWGGLPDSGGKRRKAINEETEEGKRLIYRESTRRMFTLKFRVLEADAEILRTLHDAVNGNATAFYFAVASSDPDAAYLVRKAPGHAPKELDDPAIVDGETVSVWDYELTLLEEVAAAEILA